MLLFVLDSKKKFFYVRRNKNLFFCFFYRNCFHTLDFFFHRLTDLQRKRSFQWVGKFSSPTQLNMKKNQLRGCQATIIMMSNACRPIVLKLVMTSNICIDMKKNLWNFFFTAFLWISVVTNLIKFATICDAIADDLQDFMH